VPGLASRAEALERLSGGRSRPFDLLVVGGGITGAGVALDAASRGMTVALVERNDFASGTSSKSSKLVHGGLRYLEQRELGLVREASKERDLLGRLAPQLVQPMQMVIPVSNRWRRAMFGVGLWTYDALASFRNIKVHRYLSVEDTEALVPPLPKGKLMGGFSFYDSSTDDVRLVIEVLRQARRHGTALANYCSVENIEPGADVSFVHLKDTYGGQSFETAARRVIVAAGVWGDEIESRTKRDAPPRLRPSKGIHLAFSRDVIPMTDAAAFVPDADRKRMLFVIPWLDAVIVGTTDTDYYGDIDHPAVEDEDRRYVLDALNSSFDVEVHEEDIAGAWAGLRPLIASKKGATADLSRRHAIYDIAEGVIGITGGKLTTYRRMARDVVNRMASDLGIDAKCRTGWIKLGTDDIDALKRAVDHRAKHLGIGEAARDNLVRAYGNRALGVLDLASSLGLTEPLTEGFTPLAVEAAYCARWEMAVHLEDLLARRTRLALVDKKAGLGGSSNAVSLMAGELGWDESARNEEIESYVAAIERERGLPLPEGVRPSPAGSR
jgi:glycerol-3-phosphate dehydrogenase